VERAAQIGFVVWCRIRALSTIDSIVGSDERVGKYGVIAFSLALAEAGTSIIRTDLALLSRHFTTPSPVNV